MNQANFEWENCEGKWEKEETKMNKTNRNEESAMCKIDNNYNNIFIRVWNGIGIGFSWKWEDPDRLPNGGQSK